MGRPALGLPWRRAQTDYGKAGRQLMITTKNAFISAEQADAAEQHLTMMQERAAKMRAAKVAKAAARKADKEKQPWGAVQIPVPLTSLSCSPELRNTILELQSMYVPGSHPYELAAKALRMLERPVTEADLKT